MTAQPITRESIANGGFIRETLNPMTMAPTQRGGTSARFYNKEVVNPERTKAAGGALMYDTQIEVELRFAGDNSMGPTRRITTVTGEIVGQEYIDRFPAQWGAFKKGEEVAVHGTPIETWPLCDRALALSFKSLNIMTVEDLATVSDGVIDKLGLGARSYRSKAQAFLAAAEGSAEAMRLAGERDEALAREKATNARLALLEEKLAKITTAPVGAPVQPNTEPLPPVAPPGSKAMSDADVANMLAAAAGPTAPRRGRPPNPR